MKEKIKKFFKSITLEQVFAWVFVFLFVSVIVEGIYKGLYMIGVSLALPYLIIAMQDFKTHKLKKECQSAKNLAADCYLDNMASSKALDRYKKLYGELPPEEETKEEEKKEEQ